jgi:hypothetical protein
VASLLVDWATLPELLWPAGALAGPAGALRSQGQALEALADLGGPREAADWRRLFDRFPYLSAGPGRALWPLLEAAADWAPPAACRDALRQLEASAPPGGLAPEAEALAAELSLAAGERDKGALRAARARAALAHRSGREAAVARIRLACAFGTGAGEALAASQELIRRFGRRSWTVELKARSLFAAGRKEEARALLAGQLRGLPGRGRARIARLQAAWKGR